MKQYGDLNYDQETGNFNKIKDNELNLKSGILDENAFLNEIDKGFQFHSQGGGTVKKGNIAGIDEDVIVTSTTNRSTRSAARVKSVLEGELAAKDYRGEREQYYMMKQTVGDTSPEDYINGVLATPEELAKRDEEALVARGVEKLTGKKGHINKSVKSLSSVTGSSNDNKDKFNDEVRDNIGSDELRGRTAETNYDISSLIKAGTLKGYSSPQDLIQSATSPTGDGRDFHTGFAALNEQGQFIDDKVGYTNWINANHKGSELGEVVPLSLLNSYNTSEQSQDVTVYYRDSKNKRNLLPFRSSAELVEHNQNTDNDVVWIKKTGTSKSEAPVYSKNSEGHLLTKDGIVIKDMEGNPTGDPSKIASFGPNAGLKPQVSYKDIPSYNTHGNVITAKNGDLKEFTTTKLDTLGRVTEEKELVHTDQWFAISRSTGLYTTYSMDIISNPARFPKSK